MYKLSEERLPMRYVLILIILTIAPAAFFSCGEAIAPLESVGVGPWTKKIDSPEIVHTIQHYLAYLRHEKHLRLEDSGVYYNDYVNTVRMEFISQDVLEVREARFLLVDVVEGLLAELNKNPVLAPEFITYPLQPQQLEIYINFESFHGMYVDPYYVGFVKLEEGNAHYYAFNTKYNGLDTWNYRIEPYSKSLEFTVFEREAENVFKQTVEMANPPVVEDLQYVSPIKEVPRYFSPYKQKNIFDK
jgi:hypothetical protein